MMSAIKRSAWSRRRRDPRAAAFARERHERAATSACRRPAGAADIDAEPEAPTSLPDAHVGVRCSPSRQPDRSFGRLSRP